MRNHFLRVRSLRQKIMKLPFSVRVAISVLLIIALATSSPGQLKGISVFFSPRIASSSQSFTVLVSVDETAEGSEYRHNEWVISPSQLAADMNGAVSNLHVDGNQTTDITGILDGAHSSLDILIDGTNVNVTIDKIGGENIYQSSVAGIQYQRLGNQLRIISSGETVGWLTISGAADSAQQDYLIAALLTLLGRTQILHTELDSTQGFGQPLASPTTIRGDPANVNKQPLAGQKTVVQPVSSNIALLILGVAAGVIIGTTVGNIIREKSLRGCVACCSWKFSGRGQNGTGTAVYSFLRGCRCIVNNVTYNCP
jgi:uncharacterized membrane protein